MFLWQTEDEFPAGITALQLTGEQLTELMNPLLPLFPWMYSKSPADVAWGNETLHGELQLTPPPLTCALPWYV